jgi:hypothetical protein
MSGTQVIVDPFFDQNATGGVRCNTPDPTGYHDPAALGPGAIPISSDIGLRGTVIPRATNAVSGGMSQGHDPHVPQRRVIIDPDIPGQSCVVDMGQMTQAAVAAASQNVQHAGRTGASEIYHNLAEQQKQAAAAPEQPVVMSQAPAPVSHQPAPAPAAAAVPTNMLEAFGSVNPPRPAPTHQTVQLSQPAAAASVAAPATVQPPTLRATFEIQGVGQIEAWYHDISVDGATLALVADTAYPGPKFFPNQTEQPFAVFVERDQRLYLALSLGIQYSLGTKQHCCLLIKEARDLTEEQVVGLNSKLRPGT